jgi:hypothetical protein
LFRQEETMFYGSGSDREQLLKKSQKWKACKVWKAYCKKLMPLANHLLIGILTNKGSGQPFGWNNQLNFKFSSAVKFSYKN